MKLPPFLDPTKDKPKPDEPKFDSGSFVANPKPLLPVCLCLDTSWSMDPFMADLNEGIQVFFKEVEEDSKARQLLEIAIVKFGPDVQVVRDFLLFDRASQAPELSASGGTPMGAAISQAMDLLERRKGLYQSRGQEYFQPWLVVMTDGEPTDPDAVWMAAAKRISEMASNKKLSVFPIAVGPEANLSILQQFSPGRAPARLRGDLTGSNPAYRFRDFFGWLSTNAIARSESAPGEKISLTPPGWAMVD